MEILRCAYRVVHTAPGHGHDDYLACRRYGIEPFCPVQADGSYDAAVDAGKRPSTPAFAGLNIASDASPAVLDALEAAGHLLHSESYSHRYPYDWRTKQPVIIRATEQWFAQVEVCISSSFHHHYTMPPSPMSLADATNSPAISSVDCFMQLIADILGQA